ncbi:MAG: hypothetical protein RLZZ501_254 [Pseudomonadota bacterium]|jgi:hypothetical protein
MNTITRRSLLVGAAAATVCGAAVAPAAGPHPDAELIATYAEWLDCDRAWTRSQIGSDETSEDDTEVRYEKWTALLDIFDQRRATTPEGLAILALVALGRSDDMFGDLNAPSWDGYSRPPQLDEKGNREHHILWNIVESARAMTAH